MEDEVFVEVPGFEAYLVSNYGNVYSTKSNKVLAVRVSHKYYSRVSLLREGKAYDKRVHRLVAEAFIPNPLNKPEVNHINGIRNDNRVVNLEWVTSDENTTHKVNILVTGDSFQGVKNGNSKLSVEDILAIRGSVLRNVDLSKIYNVSASHIHSIKIRKLWKHI